MVTIRLEGIYKSFGTEAVLKDINLTVGNKEFVTILGESGSGKTTILKIIAGLIEQDKGHVFFDSQIIDGWPPGARKIGYVPQSQILFPHMRVFDNVAFGLYARKEPREVIRVKVQSILSRMGLEEMSKKYPHQLSGGQMQRVALARSLVTEPEVLLLDEPLSSLDSFLRQRLGFLVRDIQQEANIPAIMVTHSWDEALMSDRIVVLEKGKLVQEGPPEEIARQPASEEVAKLTGLSNVIVIEDTEKKFAVLDSSNYKVILQEDKGQDEASSKKTSDWLHFSARIASITEDLTGMNYYRVIVHLDAVDQYLVIKINRDNLDNGELKNQSKVVIAVRKNAFKQVSG